MLVYQRVFIGEVPKVTSRVDARAGEPSSADGGHKKAAAKSRFR